MTRLSLAALDRLPAAVARPRFDPRGLGIGIVHLGCGAFHRAHQAVYTQAAIEAAGGEWGILGVSLQSPATLDRLVPQGGRYAVLERGGSEASATVVGALRGVAFAPEAREAVIARLADAHTRIVSLTVTEKGYCHDPATGRLDERHPEIVHDPALTRWIAANVAFPSTMVDRIVPATTGADVAAVTRALEALEMHGAAAVVAGA